MSSPSHVESHNTSLPMSDPPTGCQLDRRSLASEQSLNELTALAQAVRDVLAPVKPPPAFVEGLGQKLNDAASESSVEVRPLDGPSWIVGAAALGSALSLLGLFRLWRGSHPPMKRAS